MIYQNRREIIDALDTKKLKNQNNYDKWLLETKARYYISKRQLHQDLKLKVWC